MRRGAFLVFLLLAGCGEDAAPPDTVEEAPGVEPIGAAESEDLPEPHHEGRALRVGPHFVEVLFFEDGTLHAWMLGPRAPRPSQLTMHAEAFTTDGVRGVPLAWNPEDARFEGSAGAEAAVGRFALRLEVDGASHRGAVEPLSFRASEDTSSPPAPVVATPLPTAPSRPATGRRRGATRPTAPPAEPPEPATPAPTTPEPTTPEPTTPEPATPTPTTPEPATPEPATPEPTPEPDPPSGGRRVRPAPL